MTTFKPLSERYEVQEDGCWLWTGARTGSGYACFGVNGKIITAHRYFFEFYHSTRIPPKMKLDHLCRRKHCVNPAHLEVVTNRENILRCSYSPTTINSKKTECPQGHPYSGDNLYLRPDGARVCRTCVRIDGRLRGRARRDRQYAAYYTAYNKIVDEGR
jgi:hypothetical protein